MSEHRLLPSFVLVLALFGTAFVADAGCSQSHPEGSTETGNPPVIAPELVALVVSFDEVRVVGEPGAVTPGGIEIQVRTLGSGETVTAAVAPDGSFDVEVNAAPEDAFEVRAVDGAETSPAVYVVRGGAAVGEDDGGGLTCDQRSDLALVQIEQAVSNADTSCGTDDDCTSRGLAMVCHGSCQHVVVSQDGGTALDAVLDGIEAGLCASFEEDGCQVSQPPCPPGPMPGDLTCDAGTCVRRGEDPAPDCETCLDEEISWGMVNFFGLPGPEVDASRYVLTGCGDHELRTHGGFVCGTSLPLCDGDAITLQDLRNLLADPDVIAAFDAGEYLYRVPGPDEPYFDLRVGDRFLSFGPDCIDGRACNMPTASVAALRTLLDDIATQQWCRPPDCLLAYDPGTGTDSLGAYSFDPRAGTCVPRVYTGSGGNANRFDDFATCAGACPILLEDPGCPPEYTYVADACVAPGLAGGCPISTPACLMACAEPFTDCGPDAFAPCGGRGYCEVYSPF